ncbi:rhomboid family intramembrane serine protease [Gammaproteobacteria bacterium 42_54_T18]|nr:rhomboid family intramembrane serine protease [Gammaproteobacteria bacterium 42_54_T18]
MKDFADDVVLKVKVMLCFVAILWAVEVVNLILGYELNRFGIVPREIAGLRGLILSPFLHGSVNHLALNTGPLFILGLLVISRGISAFLLLTFTVSIIGGFGVWSFGQASSVHVGASGVIFSYFGYLVFKGLFDKKLKALLVSIGVFTIYGSMIWGVFPGTAGISWEGHLFGFLAGVACAYLARHKKYVPSDN